MAKVTGKKKMTREELEKQYGTHTTSDGFESATAVLPSNVIFSLDPEQGVRNFTGIFQSMKEIDNEMNTETGKQRVYLFLSEDTGLPYSVFGSGALDYQLNILKEKGRLIPNKSLVKIVFNGKRKIKDKPGQQVKDFAVYSKMV